MADSGEIIFYNIIILSLFFCAYASVIDKKIKFCKIKGVELKNF